LSKVGVDVKIELFKKIDDMQNERKVALKALVKAVSNTALKIQYKVYSLHHLILLECRIFSDVEDIG